MEIAEVKEQADKICENISKVLIGREKEIRVILAALFAGGHVLVEDRPGTGKTLLAKTFAKSIGGQFKRVQFTPDLMPSDITGLSIYNRKSEDFVLVKGPVLQISCLQMRSIVQHREHSPVCLRQWKSSR